MATAPDRWRCRVIDDLWYKNAIIYSLDLETFMDANGDGVGDLEGLMQRLDHLEALGVDVLWIAPFQPSPNRDNGYDVSDYYGVDPRHGSGGDFVELVHQARRRGMRVIMDLVVNHTSDQHPWFQQSRSDPESLYRDWYIWSEERPPDWNQGMVFPGVQDSTWDWDEEAQAWYFHRFFAHQPDLNMDHAPVRDEVRRIIGYWLQLGVSGFRVDAVPFIIEHPKLPSGARTKDPHFEYLEEFRTFQQWRAGDALLLGEANLRPEDVARYFAGGHGLNMMFNFWVNQHLFLALATQRAAPLIEALEATRELPATCQWAHFLRNHDELDLGRLKAAERRKVFERFGPDPCMQLYDRGIRRRMAPMMGSRHELELANSLMLSLPGAPVLRYGDEIGMGDDLSLEGRHAVRTPMQWSDSPGGGFSTADAFVHPIIDEGPYGLAHVNVERQRRDPGSLLRWTTEMIALRKQAPEIGWGRWEVLPCGSDSVLVMLYEWRGSAVLIAHNLADRAEEVELCLTDYGEVPLLNLRSQEELTVSDGRYRIVIDAFGYRWYRVGTAVRALERGPDPRAR